jgi:hypothetical protein
MSGDAWRGGPPRVEVSAYPRPADIVQLDYARVLHAVECMTCQREEPCVIGQRLSDAQRLTQASP